MSEYNVVELQWKDRDCIVESLQEMGYPCEIHETPQSLIGFHGDQRSQKANIIVRRTKVGSASNDIGFLKKPDGTYEMIISEYDQGAAHGKKFTETMKVIYGKNVTLKQARRLGLSVTSVINDKGRVRIKLRDYGTR